MSLENAVVQVSLSGPRMSWVYPLGFSGGGVKYSLEGNIALP